MIVCMYIYIYMKMMVLQGDQKMWDINRIPRSWDKSWGTNWAFHINGWRLMAAATWLHRILIIALFLTPSFGKNDVTMSTFYPMAPCSLEKVTLPLSRIFSVCLEVNSQYWWLNCSTPHHASPLPTNIQVWIRLKLTFHPTWVTRPIPKTDK